MFCFSFIPGSADCSIAGYRPMAYLSPIVKMEWAENPDPGGWIMPNEDARQTVRYTSPGEYRWRFGHPVGWHERPVREEMFLIIRNTEEEAMQIYRGMHMAYFWYENIIAEKSGVDQLIAQMSCAKFMMGSGEGI